MNKKILVLLPAILLLSYGAFVEITNSVPKAIVQTPTVFQEVTPTQTEITPVAPVAPVAFVDVVPAPAETITSAPAPEPAQPAQPAPVVYKWATEIASVGIAESDYGYVTDTVLDDNGWRVTGDKIWRKSFDTKIYTNLHDKILFANNYVVANYGTWKAAYDSYVNRSNF